MPLSPRTKRGVTDGCGPVTGPAWALLHGSWRSVVSGHLPVRGRRLPRTLCSRGGRIEVRLDPNRELLHVLPELVGRRPAPEPVADVDLLDLQARRQDQRVGDVRRVDRVGVLTDVERRLHLEV